MRRAVNWPSVGDTSTYSYAFGDPPWLNLQIPDPNGGPKPVPARLNLETLPDAGSCPAP
jgi:hypothetical protein